MNANDKQQGQQQRDGSQSQGQDSQQQQQSGQGQQYGEGSYSGTKQYNEGLKKHMNQHDVEKEALDAAPKSEAEAREMEEAERLAASRSKGEGDSPASTK